MSDNPSDPGDTAVKHRDAGLWVNNLEVFLAAQPDVPYGQLALSPTGGLAALRHEIVEGVLRSEAWDVKPAVRQRLDSNGWSVAVALPLAGLLPGRPVEPGARLYANFMRTRRFDNQASWSWSPVFADGYAQSLHRMGTIFLAPLVPGGEFPVNGAFASTNGIVPDGWILNRPAGPDADQSAAAREGRFLLAGGSTALHAYHQTLQPARRGDRIVLEFTVAGTGQGAAGVYLNAGGGDGAGSRIEQWPLTPEPQPHSLTVTVHHASPDRFVAGFRPVLGAAPRSRAEFSGFRVRLLPRGSDAPGPYHDSE